MTTSERTTLQIALLLKNALIAAGVTPAALRQLRELRELRKAIEARPALRGRAS